MRIRVKDHVKFQSDKMAKIALATTVRAQLDLYCVAPGQAQKPHSHADQDKIYYVLEGAAASAWDPTSRSSRPGRRWSPGRASSTASSTMARRPSSRSSSSRPRPRTHDRTPRRADGDLPGRRLLS